MDEIELLRKQNADLLSALKSLVYEESKGVWCVSRNGDDDVTALVGEAIANATQNNYQPDVVPASKSIDSAKFEELLFAYRDAEFITGHMRDIISYANEWNHEQLKDLFKRIRKLERELSAAHLANVAALGEPTMLWEADEPEDGMTGDNPKDFAESYASNAGLPGETHLVDVLCAYRGGKRTMRIEMLPEGGVAWSWVESNVNPSSIGG